MILIAILKTKGSVISKLIDVSVTLDLFQMGFLVFPHDRRASPFTCLQRSPCTSVPALARACADA